MIDPATVWLKIVLYNDKQATTVTILLEQTWLCRYPGPLLIIYDLGGWFTW